MTGTRLIRLGLFVMVALGLAAVGGWFLFKNQSSEQFLKSGEASYAAGVEALKDKKGSRAELRFQEAKIRAENALKRIDEESRARKNPNPEQIEEWTELSGKALYLKAVALRDEAFAKGLIDEKEIPETMDTSSGKTFRSFLAIAEPKARDDAITSLRNAAQRLPKNAEVQNEAIRVEVTLQPIAWMLAHRYAMALLELKPEDTRARYLLARYEFEQPQIGVNQVTGPPKASEKRSRTRVGEALGHIVKLKESKDYPMGRTLFLEAQIRQWLAADYKNRDDATRAAKELDALNTLLFDARDGALAQTRAGEGLKNLSLWDEEGILGMHLLALEFTAEQQRKKGDALGKVKATLADTIALVQKLEQDGVSAPHLERLAGTLVSALARTQSVLATDSGKEWKQALEATKVMLKKSHEKGQGSPLGIAEFSVLLQREAMVADKAKDAERAKNLRKEARAWVEDGLADFEKRKLPAAQAMELHALAAELQYAANGKRLQIEPHLKALRESKLPQMQGLAHLIEGVVEEREGRLDKARQHLEKVINLAIPDLVLRANMALTSVYLGLGKPDKALTSLHVLDRVYERFEELTPQEKVWSQQFLRSPEDMAVLEVVANLETAKQALAKYARDNPKKPFPPALFLSHEKAVESILNKLPAQKKHSLEARKAWISYFASMGRLERAEKEFAVALSDHADSASLLQLGVALMVQQAREKAGGMLSKEDEKDLTAKIDKKIQQFIATFPEDRQARLFWASWLARSGRNDQALAYINNPVNFPDGKDETLNRLTAIILMAKGDKQEASKLLQQLPQDPLIDAVLIQMADSTQAKQKSVEQALARYVSNGLFRIWNAELAFHEKRYADAALSHFNALDYTQVQAVAKTGLQRSLLALAAEKPADARKMADDMLKTYPNEPALLLAYAVACLNLDDVGQLEDNWETTKTMAAALQVWEQAVLNAGGNRALTTVTKAELWLRANHLDIARVEVLRALEQNPGDQVAITLAIRLDLTSSSKTRLADARKYLQDLKKLNPDAASMSLLEAQIEAADGRAQQAIGMLEKLLEKQPKESNAYALLVNLSTAEKQSAQTLQWSQTWADKLPEDLEAVQNLVTQLVLAKKVDDAKNRAKAFTQTRLKEIHKQLAELKFAESKDPDQARKALYEDVRLELELRFAQAFMRGADHDEAERRLTAIVKEKPEAIGALMALGEIHLARKAWKESVQVYEKILDIDKGNFVVGNNLAWVLATQLKQPDKALELLRSVSKGRFSGKMLPGDRLHPEVLDTLGTIYLQLNRADLHKEMSQIFEAARKRYPRDPRMYLYSGHAYAELNDKAKALQMFDSAIALANDKEVAGIGQAMRESVTRAAEAAKKKWANQ